MASWLSNSTILIRDEGEYEPEVPGVSPEIPEHNPWPEGTGVRIKSRFKGGDLNDIRKLTLNAQMNMRGDTVDTQLKIAVYYTELIYCAVMIHSFEGGAVEHDEDGNPEERPFDVEGKPGTLLTMPDDLEERFKLAEQLPVEVIEFVNREIARRVSSSPLAGTKPRETSTSSASTSNSTKPHESKTSHKTKSTSGLAAETGT